MRDFSEYFDRQALGVERFHYPFHWVEKLFPRLAHKLIFLLAPGEPS